MNSRLIAQVVQGSAESIIRTLDVSKIGSSPTSPSVVVIDLGSNTDVTSTVIPSGSLAVNGNVITMKPLTSLTPGRRYRVALSFTLNSSILQYYWIVSCDW